MTLILIIFCIWGASALIRAAKENKRRREEKARSEQIKRMQREYQRQKAEAAEWTRKQIEMEREQRRIAREQERQAKEQEKQSAILEKHEKRIADLEFRMSQAESDIEFLKDRIAQLDAQRDYLLLLQAGTVPGSKEHTKYQTKIISIENQIHTAENKLNKAKFEKSFCEDKLAS